MVQGCYFRWGWIGETAGILKAVITAFLRYGKITKYFLGKHSQWSIAQWGLSGTVADSLSCNIHPPLLEQWNGWGVTRYPVTKDDTVKVSLAGYGTRFGTRARIICASCKIMLLNGVVMSFPFFFLECVDRYDGKVVILDHHKRSIGWGWQRNKKEVGRQVPDCLCSVRAHIYICLVLSSLWAFVTTNVTCTLTQEHYQSSSILSTRMLTTSPGPVYGHALTIQKARYLDKKAAQYSGK